MDVKVIVENYGGTSQAAKAFGVAPNVVSNWKRRGQIPSEVILRTPELLTFAYHEMLCKQYGNKAKK